MFCVLVNKFECNDLKIRIKYQLVVQILQIQTLAAKDAQKTRWPNLDLLSYVH